MLSKGEKGFFGDVATCPQGGVEGTDGGVEGGDG